MSRDKLVDKFDECFGISTATEAQRKKFFDWVMAQQQAAQQSAHPTPCPECGKVFSHYTGCSRGVEISAIRRW